jgi:hypothetical protein
VQISGAYQSIPGPQVLANANTLNTATSLGRLFTGGTAATTKPIQLIAPGSHYGERLHQIDLRFAKLIRYRGARTAFSVDVYNVTNADTVLTQNNGFNPTIAAGLPGSWTQPQAVLAPRFVKLGVQVDF